MNDFFIDKLEDKLLVFQDFLIQYLEERLSTQINYRFGTHSEKSFGQLSLFDDLDDDFFPEAEMLTSEELQETIEENKLSVKAYKRRKSKNSAIVLKYIQKMYTTGWTNSK